MSEDLTGRRLGHYRIDGVLGKGGMSTMYRATDVRLGRKVALKVIAEHLTVDPEFRERFVDEARNTSAIDHSNVVPLYDFGEVDGLLYIAMRMVDGADLAKLIKDGPLSPSRAMALLTQVAGALDNLHDSGLVHLDIKPANVLVTSKESANEHIYLADFGLTRRGATGHRTRGGDFLGSPTFAAPEHLRGEPVDHRTDQYSLACVLYACLSGRPPFRGQVPDVISGHLGGEIPKITDVVDLPEAVDAVVAKGMAKRPGDRYDSCRELIEAAQKALAGVANPELAPRVRRAGAAAPRPADLRQVPPPAQPRSPMPPQPPQQNGAPGYPPQQQPPGDGQQHLPYANGFSQQQYPMQPQGQRPPQQQNFPQPQQFGPQGQGGYQPAQPVRLRAPMPADNNAFGAQQSPVRGGGGKRWVWPVLIGAVVVIAAVALIIVLTRDSSGGGSGVQVPTSTQTQNPLPTKIPIQTR